MNVNTMLADAVAAPQTATGTQAPSSGIQALLSSPLPMFVLFGVVFYFVLIRPQSQQRKKQADLLSKLKSGDKVITTTGIVGVVIAVKDTTVTLKSFDAKVEVIKSSVTQILESSTALES